LQEFAQIAEHACSLCPAKLRKKLSWLAKTKTLLNKNFALPCQHVEPELWHSKEKGEMPSHCSEGISPEKNSL